MFTLFLLHQWTSAAAPVVVVPDNEGLEYTMPSNKLHFKFNENVTQYTIDSNRLHYQYDDEDL